MELVKAYKALSSHTGSDSLSSHAESGKARSKRQLSHVGKGHGQKRVRKEEKGQGIQAAKAEFEKRRDETLEQLPELYKKEFNQIGFCKWKTTTYPVLVLSPYAVPPHARDVWFDQFEKAKNQGNLENVDWLVYWYGFKDKCCYSVVKPARVTLYEAAKEKGTHELPAVLNRKIDAGKKLSKRDQELFEAFKEMKEDLGKLPASRRRGVVDFLETHEHVEDFSSESDSDFALSQELPNDPDYRCFYQTFDAEKRRWKTKMIPWDLESNFVGDIRRETLNLPLGGELHVYPGWMLKDAKTHPDRIQKELEECGHFRQYEVRSSTEPRAHVLLHEDATENFDDPQPGYGYAQVRMKSRPLESLPCVAELARQALQVCEIKKWDNGANIVFCRDGRDKIGFHSDNKQKETKIFTTIVHTSSDGWAIIVQPIPPQDCGTRFPHEARRYILKLSTGDAYEMNDDMQEKYHHAVRKWKGTSSNAGPERRAVIVFRTGEKTMFDNDSGTPLDGLDPRPLQKNAPPGNNVPGLEEGHVYNRKMLEESGAHVLAQRSVSGSAERGCEAIIISGARKDGLGEDKFHSLTYAVESSQGGGSLRVNKEKNLPVRVFRSSNEDEKNPFRSKPFVKPNSQVTKGYRYDGVYEVTDYRGNKTLYFFELRRLPVGKDPIHNNRVSTEALIKDCPEAREN